MADKGLADELYDKAYLIVDGIGPDHLPRLPGRGDAHARIGAGNGMARTAHRTGDPARHAAGSRDQERWTGLDRSLQREAVGGLVLPETLGAPRLQRHRQMLIGRLQRLPTQATFHQDVEGDTPVLVDFWAPWCAPCLALAPHLATLAASYAGRLKVLKLNVDEAPGGWQHFGVRAIPTLAFYSAGKEYGRLVGPSTMRLQLMVEKWLGELGLVVPALQRASLETRNAALPADAPEETWNSFGGDVAVKEAGIARLRNCSQEEAYQPSRQLAGDEAQFEAIVGMPMALGDLLGMLYWLQSQNDEKTARAQTLEIVDAMPVGASLGAVTAKVLYDLLYLSPWAISQYRQNARA